MWYQRAMAEMALDAYCAVLIPHERVGYQTFIAPLRALTQAI